MAVTAPVSAAVATGGGPRAARGPGGPPPASRGVRAAGGARAVHGGRAALARPRVLGAATGLGPIARRRADLGGRLAAVALRGPRDRGPAGLRPGCRRALL